MFELMLGFLAAYISLCGVHSSDWAWQRSSELVELLERD